MSVDNKNNNKNNNNNNNNNNNDDDHDDDHGTSTTAAAATAAAAQSSSSSSSSSSSTTTSSSSSSSLSSSASSSWLAMTPPSTCGCRAGSGTAEPGASGRPVELKNLKNATRIAIDIGGSLAKIAYCSLVHQKCFRVSDHLTDSDRPVSIYQVSESDQYVPRVYLVQFETKYIEYFIEYISKILQDGASGRRQAPITTIKATGGGSWKHRQLIESKLGVRLSMEDEVHCATKGCGFLLKTLPDEAFTFEREGQPQCHFLPLNSHPYPFLLVNIGSGVVIAKVESDTEYQWVGGSPTGGATFYGLGSLLTKGKSFNELLVLADQGDRRSVDMLVSDIYGNYSHVLNMAPDQLASSFGKVQHLNLDCSGGGGGGGSGTGGGTGGGAGNPYNPADAIASLLGLICNDIGQIASLYAQMHQCDRIYMGGGFLRCNPLTMHLLNTAITLRSKGKVRALFLRHEGYLGAVGSFLIGAEEDGDKNYIWGENLANNTGLTSGRDGVNWTQYNTLDSFELECLERELVPCPLLRDLPTYHPDTVDLTMDTAARTYWLQCFTQMVDKISQQAIKSDPASSDVQQRAAMFRAKYLQRLAELGTNPCSYGTLTVRSLLNTIGHFLQEFRFTDAYSQVKLSENELSLSLLPECLSVLEQQGGEERLYSLVKGVLAGNMFDWGAHKVVNIMESQQFGFKQAMDKIQARPWLVDDFDLWVKRRMSGPAYKCAVVFCDNSGADIVLGLFPFVKDLILEHTKVILCANSQPSLNDIVHSELKIILKRFADLDPVIGQAVAKGQLLVMESGQGSPCLDLRLIDKELASHMVQSGTDLVILEGMGRAIHTNYDAHFSCDSLKMAILKNDWLAQRLGGKIFDVVFKYEPRAL
ncbi:pantothenate kinase 4-like [Argonauta hians]